MFGGKYGLPCGIEFFGADKVVFASDAPLAPIPVHVKVLDQTLEDMKLGPDVRRKMMVGNAEKLLNMSFG